MWSKNRARALRVPAPPTLYVFLRLCTVPAKEAFQEVKHAKVDAIINTGGVMKRLDYDGLKKRYVNSPACGVGSPHEENVATSACGAGPLNAKMKWASCGKLHFSASII